jgi:hypothetical protein
VTKFSVMSWREQVTHWWDDIYTNTLRCHGENRLLIDESIFTPTPWDVMVRTGYPLMRWYLHQHPEMSWWEQVTHWWEYIDTNTLRCHGENRLLIDESIFTPTPWDVMVRIDDSIFTLTPWVWLLVLVH